MAISRMIQDRESGKFLESTDVADQIGVVVVNPDGSTVGAAPAASSVALNDGASSAIKATVKDYTNSNPLAVVSVDTNGDYVAAGGGTQYADGAVRGTATGTIAMVDDGTNIQSMSGDATGKPNVNVSNTPTVKISQTTTDNDVDVASIAAGDNNIGNVDVVTLPAVTGTVTANAGTNLNTSALALEAGGNLAGINAKLVTGTDIGDVTINNAAAGSAVNIQDGGNTITVDGTVTTTPLPSGKADVDSKFSLSVATGAQTNQTIDSDAATNRAVKEIYVAANGFFQ